MSEKITKTDAEWQAQLTPEQYHVTRKHGTERAHSGPHNEEKAAGVYRCVCCGRDVFSSQAKYESGTGWPSFTAPASPDAVGEGDDRSFFMRRTEIHCAGCDAHLGHLFPDGPPPTKKRYCINGVALQFEPEA